MASTERNVAIVGAGLIGRAWAAIFARAGWNVRLTDPHVPTLVAAPRLIRDELLALAHYGLAGDPDGAVARVSVAGSLKEAVMDVEFDNKLKKLHDAALGKGSWKGTAAAHNRAQKASARALLRAFVKPAAPGGHLAPLHALVMGALTVPEGMRPAACHTVPSLATGQRHLLPSYFRLLDNLIARHTPSCLPRAGSRQREPSTTSSAVRRRPRPSECRSGWAVATAGTGPGSTSVTRPEPAASNAP